MTLAGPSQSMACLCLSVKACKKFSFLIRDQVDSFMIEMQLQYLDAILVKNTME